MLIATRVLDLFSAMAIMLACVGVEINFGYLMAMSLKLVIGTAVLVNLVVQIKRFAWSTASDSLSPIAEGESRQ